MDKIEKVVKAVKAVKVNIEKVNIEIALDIIWKMKSSLQNMMLNKKIPPTVSIKLGRIGKVLYDEIDLIEKERIKMLHTYIDELRTAGRIKVIKPKKGQKKKLDPYLDVKLDDDEAKVFQDKFNEWMKNEPVCSVPYWRIPITEEQIEKCEGVTSADWMFTLLLFNVIDEEEE